MFVINRVDVVIEASGKLVREIYTPLIPHFYIKKNGVCRVIPYFLIFDPKIAGGSNVYPQCMFLSEDIKKIKIFPMKFQVFAS